LLIFTVTVLVTVTTDLLIGIGVGIALRLLLSLVYVGLWHTLRDDHVGSYKPSLLAHLVSLFRNPVTRRELVGDRYHLYLDGPLVCSNLFHMIRELGNRPHEAQGVYLHLSSHVPLVDHTAYEALHHFLEEINVNGDHPDMAIDGWDHLRPLSTHERSTRIALAASAKVDFTEEAEEELRATQVTD
jgi:carbonic anhydrase